MPINSGCRVLRLAGLALTGLALTGLVLAAAPARCEDMIGSSAILQGLDKVTARVTTIIAPNDFPIRFGTLEIIARTCRKRPPEEPPESAAYLDIRDIKPGEPARPLFQGWMFASSPALSALEHPVYDIWVLDCGVDEISSHLRTSPSAISE